MENNWEYWLKSKNAKLEFEFTIQLFGIIFLGIYKFSGIFAIVVLNFWLYSSAGWW